MKFWTIQSKDVIKTVNAKGIFEPDFNKSRYLAVNPALKDLYYKVLQSFNTHNKMNLHGVVFAFAQSYSPEMFQIKNIDDFTIFIQDNRPVISGFLKELDKDNVEIVELVYNQEFNPIYVDINAFQFLMPPYKLIYPFTENSCHRINTCISEGKLATSELPSDVIQAHLPYIKKENVLNTYPIFEL